MRMMIGFREEMFCERNEWDKYVFYNAFFPVRAIGIVDDDLGAIVTAEFLSFQFNILHSWDIETTLRQVYRGRDTTPAWQHVFFCLSLDTFKRIFGAWIESDMNEGDVYEVVHFDGKIWEVKKLTPFLANAHNSRKCLA